MIIHNCEGVDLTVEKMTIYMDNSATTPVRKEVVEEMIPYMTENFGIVRFIFNVLKLT